MGPRILIIDDNEADRDLISLYLKKAGFDEIFTAVNGEDGFEVTKQNKPSLVILDVLLPKINGFETARRIQQSMDTIPQFIIISGNQGLLDELKIKENRINACWLKSSNYGGLVKIVKELITH